MKNIYVINSAGDKLDGTFTLWEGETIIDTFPTSGGVADLGKNQTAGRRITFSSDSGEEVYGIVADFALTDCTAAL